MGTDKGYLRYSRFGVVSALIAAAFFGLSTPFAKILAGMMSPLMLAGLLYLGSWAGLCLVSLVRGLNARYVREPGLEKGDYIYLVGSIAAGGIAAPILLILGLKGSAGSVASLILNVEVVFTALIASFVFKEEVGRRVWCAAGLMLIAGSVLTTGPSPAGWFRINAGPVLVAGAALMWSIDNNLTRRLSHKDPFLIARIKGLAAGTASLFLALVANENIPEPAPLASALILGALSYGVSLVFFVYALRHLGAARTGAYFGIAPFVGMAASIVVLGEPVTLMLAAAFVFMAGGLWLVMKEFHAHMHTHEALSHEHSHVHDEHHDHEEGTEVPHSHHHEHGAMAHSHAHVPDLHHFHKH
ncbi:MAG TPA: EamA family transporter [Deltaproteobacteria bacterium]|nr:MAG: hypothetical protein A2Z79_08145 [Deltaproteobacteria bacterium GWA2_55_82]OGQ63099.1 MAG: hypothetical protein A3I81_09775 [Deltaproteobacteria bacterium RIFCSPLOWO2_02_FULL_55_12]OIJ73558.1 MAG: hypothetical protein A2V21_304340 [Deltaproteobacteria bacterium GWC2_55_46]HBG47691.1 EamA family transporter [Deltaproteobacteria bacterium]HCY12087.1 EamA family transporter [Deltaproteobacteria bacterium]